ncbi:MAG: aldehyde oxidase, partial [Candidatus Binatia bacterium]|nr:aldehyde oxidase [Candidatus Binatia bacterium]
MSKKEFSVIGKPLPKIDSMAKCVGDTRFADDMNLPRMLYAKLLRCPHPYALIDGVRTEKAEAFPGVHAVITGRVMPTKYGILPATQDEEALAVDKARYVGDPVAAVAAVDETTAEQALKLIDVDYKILKPVLTIEDALKETDEKIQPASRHANVHKAVS